MKKAKHRLHLTQTISFPCEQKNVWADRRLTNVYQTTNLGQNVWKSFKICLKPVWSDDIHTIVRFWAIPLLVGHERDNFFGANFWMKSNFHSVISLNVSMFIQKYAPKKLSRSWPTSREIAQNRTIVWISSDQTIFRRILNDFQTVFKRFFPN